MNFHGETFEALTSPLHGESKELICEMKVDCTAGEKARKGDCPQSREFQTCTFQGGAALGNGTTWGVAKPFGDNVYLEGDITGVDIMSS